MNRLPGELLDHICSYISYSDLKSLALTERRWAAAVTPHLRTVVHVAPWRGSLARLMKKLSSMDVQSRDRIRAVNLHLPAFPGSDATEKMATYLEEQFKSPKQVREYFASGRHTAILQTTPAGYFGPSLKLRWMTFMTYFGFGLKLIWMTFMTGLYAERRRYQEGVEELFNHRDWDLTLRMIPHATTLIVDADTAWTCIARSWSLFQCNEHYPGKPISDYTPYLINLIMYSGSISQFTDLEIVAQDPHNILSDVYRFSKPLRHLDITLNPHMAQHAWDRDFGTGLKLDSRRSRDMVVPICEKLTSSSTFSLQWIPHDGPLLLGALNINYLCAFQLQHLNLCALKLPLANFKIVLYAARDTLRSLELGDIVFFRPKARRRCAMANTTAFGLFRFMVDRLRLTRAEFTGEIVIDSPHDMGRLVPKSPFTPTEYIEVTLGGELARAVTVNATHWCGPGQPPDLQQRGRWIGGIFNIDYSRKKSKPETGDTILEGLGMLLSHEAEEQWSTAIRSAYDSGVTALG